MQDLGTSRLTWRRLRVLLEALPVTSRTFAALHGPQWTVGEHLLAGVFDGSMIANWQRLAIASGQAGKQPPPFPTALPRPGDTDTAPTISPAQLLAFRARHEQQEVDAS